MVRVHAASLYPLLYRLERKRWIEGRRVERPGQRRRRFYALTGAGDPELLVANRVTPGLFSRVLLDGDPYTVVGVMPARFRFPLPPVRSPSLA